jgi:hypothetical protein
VTSLNLSGRLSEAEEVFTETVMETLVEWEGLQSLTLHNCTFPESAGLGPCFSGLHSALPMIAALDSPSITTAPLFSQLTSLQKLVLGSDEQSAGYPSA